MKKIVILVLTILIAIGLIACEKQVDKITFSGTIIELHGDNAIVEPFEGEAIRGSADKISIDLSISDETFAVGDEIIVEYDGAVMESYPAQVNVMGIEKLQ